MQNYLQDKTVLVTGAASGFGRLISTKAAVLGANVVCADVDTAGLDETVKGISELGHSAMAKTADVTQLADMHALVATALERFSSVDVMVNNAGIMPLAFYQDHERAYAAWDKCIDINIKGVLNGTVAVHDAMVQQGRGHVINLSSIYGNFPVAGAGVYGATKAAVDFLSESLRVESQGKIKVTVVKPTGVPGTNLGTGIINPEAIIGILGQNAPAYGQLLAAHQAGELPKEYMDPNSIEYYALEPEHLAEQVIYTMNQPWGVSIGEITVRATGDGYVL